MSLALMLVLQAALPPPTPLIVTPIDFDLARYRPADFSLATTGRPCARGDPSAIIVCGRRSAGAYPLDEMAAIFEPRRIVAETRLFGNFAGRAYVQGVELAPGMVSNRVMLGIRLPF